MENGENAGNQHFLLFPQCFLLLSKTENDINVTFILLSAGAFTLDMVKFLLFGNSLPNNKNLGWYQLKAFADDEINVTEKLKFVLRIENIVGKRENAACQTVLQRIENTVGKGECLL